MVLLSRLIVIGSDGDIKGGGDYSEGLGVLFHGYSLVVMRME